MVSDNSNLLEKYWLGETDIQEELSLKKDAAYSDTEDKSYFSLLNQYGELNPSDHVMDKIIRSTQEPKKIKKINSYWRMAAAVLLVFGAVSVWRMNTDVSGEDYSQAEIQQAFEQTKLSLGVLSAKLNNNAHIPQKQLSKFSQAQKKLRHE